MTVHLWVRCEPDVAAARLRAQEAAREEGLGEPATAAVGTAVTEIARNMLVHAGQGEVQIQHGRRVVVVVARDDGPGIQDVEAAMADGFSTTGGLGLGLPSARRLMDEFEIVSGPGRGTLVRMAKWAR